MTLANISEMSTTPASNTAVNGVGIQGSDLISLGDDALRQNFAMLAKFYDDYGGVNTVGGTADAITITTPTVYTALATGMRFSFIAGGDNTGAATLNFDGIGAKAVRKISGGTDVALVAGDILSGVRYDVTYSTAANAAAGGWILTATAYRSTHPATITPYANDGAALGTTALKWSDLHLADGAVINWNNGDVIATHGTDFVSVTGGSWLVGITSLVTTQNGTTPLQINNAMAGIRFNDVATNAFTLGLARARGTIGAATIVSDGDNIGNLQFEGYDGGAFVNGARIKGEVDGTPGSGDMPGRLLFQTSSDGSTSPGTRFSVNAVGFLSISSGSLGRAAPITKTGDWTVGNAENFFISNRAATNTVTLPSASTFSGREIYIKTIQAQTVVSNASNVVPITDTAAGTAILPATDGAWALLVSDGTNWIIMAKGP